MKKAASIFLAIACVSTIWLVMRGGPQQPALPRGVANAARSVEVPQEVMPAKDLEPESVGTSEAVIVRTGPGESVAKVEKAPLTVAPARSTGEAVMLGGEGEPERAAIAALLSQNLDLTNPQKRAEVVAEVRRLEEAHRLATRQKAQRLGMPEVIDLPGKPKAVLVGFDGDLPRYQADQNANAAVSLGTNLVRNTVPYEVNGTGMKLGLWEAGGVPRLSHQEFGPGGRVTVVDGATTLSDHATHVAATILGRGTVPSALGMAPGASIVAYDSANDNSEMLAVGAATAAETNKISISNHSYGFINGWSGTVWFGSFTDDGNAANDIETRFGRYDTASVAMDGMLYNLPYFLPFMSAGNDRNDNPPAPGASWAHMPSGTPRSYDPAQHPAGDGAYKAGYDILGNEKVCKNVITIGAANDALSGGLRSVAAGTLTSFSCAGPADDGRIKPDIVANGASLYSAISTSDTAYASMSGTSMAAPNASGSALLLLDYYGKRFPGQSMRASTLKALLIHTADDAGRPGPDYEYGWGLMNAKAAADLIKSEADDLSRQQLTEAELVSGASNTHRFVSNGVDPIKVTLCWTDPAGVASSAHDDRVPDVVNNLNVTVTGPSGSVHLPFVMPYVGDWSLASLTSNATTGVNNVDNVEQVLIAAPVPAGTYVVTINHAGSLTFGAQPYSLIITGGLPGGTLAVLPQDSWQASGFREGPFLPNSTTYRITNRDEQPVSWTAIASQPWVSVSPATAVLEAHEEADVAVSFDEVTGELGDGSHVAEISFTNSKDGRIETRQIELIINGKAPRLLVKNHLGGILEAGGVVDVGSHVLGEAPVETNLILTNANSESFLNLGVPFISGEDAAAYSVVELSGESNLAFGEHAILTLRFTPKKAGSHAAVLNVPSNDPQQASLLINLGGGGVPVEGPQQEIRVGRIPPQKSDSSALVLPVVATSGLPLHYEILAGPLTVDASGALIPTGIGAVTLRLSQPGNGFYSAATPVTVTFVITDTVYKFRSVSLSRNGYHSLAIDLAGRLWSWGQGGSGQLANGGLETIYVPQIADSVGSWSQVTTGALFSLGLKSDGTMWSWGNNFSGQLGLGSTMNVSSPTMVSAARWVHTAAGSEHALAIRSDGSLWGWGNNGSGRVGDGTLVRRESPVQIGTDVDWVYAAAGQNHSLAIKSDGSLWSWGEGGSGQLGQGSLASSSTPVRVGSDNDWAHVSAGGLFSLGVKRNGTLWSWGTNGNGGLGDGVTGLSTRTSPWQVGSASDWTTVEASGTFGSALKKDGSIWSWGRNFDAQIGNGDLLSQLVPVRVSGANDIYKSIAVGASAQYALDSSGLLVGWGNSSGYTGKVPRQLTRAVPPRSWRQFSHSGAHTLLISGDNNLWGFGTNGQGQIGNNTSIAQDLVLVQQGNSWGKISAGRNHSGGIRTNGTLWVWGYNAFGQVGNNSTTTRYTPALISSSSWKELALGDYHTVAIRSDGSLWAWGINNSGQLGDGTSTNKSVPVQIGTDKDWSKVAAGTGHTIALKTDGSLWTNIAYAMKRLGTENDWVEISTSASSSFALKRDGSLWAWGVNSSGQLGVGDTASRSSPVKVGGGSDWAQVSGAATWTAAIKKDGTLWAWGNNVTFQQGQAITGSISSPRQVGNSTGWMSVQAGNVSMVAMRSDGSIWTAGFTGDFRLTTAAGRSPYAHAALLPPLQNQVILPWASGFKSSRIKASSELPVELEIISGDASVAGDVLTLNGPVGSTVKYMAWQKGDENAWDAALPKQFSVTSQAITFAEIERQTYGIPLILNAQSTSSLPVSYEVLEGAGLVQMNGSRVEFTGVGRVTIQARQDGNNTFIPAEPVSRTFQVTTTEHIISWSPEVPVRAARNRRIPLLATSNLEFEPVVYSILAGPGRLEGSNLLFTGIGDVVVRASHPGKGVYQAALTDLTITSYNTTPMALGVGFDTQEDQILDATLTAKDADDDSLVFQATGVPAHGVLVLQPNGVFSYTPDPEFSGRDSFSFKVSDGWEDSLPVQVTLEVAPINDPPTALAQVVTTTDSVPVAITLTAEDVDNPSLAFALATQPAKGTISGTPPNIVYVSQAGYAGMDSFAFRVFDGSFFSSAVVTLQVGPVGVAIVQPPQPAKVSALDRVELTVTSTGTEPIQYQWIKDGEDLPGKTQPTLVMDSIEEDQAGAYSVRVSNQVDSQESEDALVTVVGGVPEIVVPPAHGVVAAGQEAVIAVTALGRPPLEYQWRKNGRAIAGATGRELRLPNVKLGDAGAYSVVVKGALDEVPSEAAQLAVVEGPGTAINLAAGGNAAWSLSAAGAGLSFAWNKDGEAVSPRVAISPDGRGVKLAKAEVEDAGTYACRVTGPGGALEVPVRRLVVVSEGPDITPLATGDALPPAIVGGNYHYKTLVSLLAHQSPASFTASGLPPGLKMDTATGVISGRVTGTKAAPYKVKITAKNPVGSDAVEVSMQVDPFPSTAVGTYVAHVPRHAWNDSLGGRLDLVCTMAGSFSGKLTLGSRKPVIIKGGLLEVSLEEGSHPEGVVELAQPAPLQPLILSIQLDPDTGHMAGKLKQEGTEMDINGWRSVWHARHNPAEAYAGLYNLGLEPAGFVDESDPAGTGYMAAVVAGAGTVKLSGKTADGEVLTGSTFLGPQGQVLVHQLLYKSKIKGSMTGTLAIDRGADADADHDNTLAGTLTWSRPAAPGLIYSDGFGPVELRADGGRYLPPEQSKILLGLAATTSNAALRFTGAAIELAEMTPGLVFQITSRNQAVLPKAGGVDNPARVMVKLDARTGKMTGTFALSDPGPDGQAKPMQRVAPFELLIYPSSRGMRGQGWFLLPQMPGTAVDSVAKTPRLSGQVRLEAP